MEYDSHAGYPEGSAEETIAFLKRHSLPVGGRRQTISTQIKKQ